MSVFSLAIRKTVILHGWMCVQSLYGLCSAQVIVEYEDTYQTYDEVANIDTRMESFNDYYSPGWAGSQKFQRPIKMAAK